MRLITSHQQTELRDSFFSYMLLLPLSEEYTLYNILYQSLNNTIDPTFDQCFFFFFAEWGSVKSLQLIRKTTKENLFQRSDNYYAFIIH